MKVYIVYGYYSKLEGERNSNEIIYCGCYSSHAAAVQHLQWLYKQYYAGHTFEIFTTETKGVFNPEYACCERM